MYKDNSKLRLLEHDINMLEKGLAVAREQLNGLLDSEYTVLVEFTPYGQPYAYRWPTDWPEPKVGDEVIVPAKYVGRGRELVTRVVGTGRGGYDGPLKTLTGRVSR